MDDNIRASSRSKAGSTRLGAVLFKILVSIDLGNSHEDRSKTTKGSRLRILHFVKIGRKRKFGGTCFTESQYLQ